MSSPSGESFEPRAVCWTCRRAQARCYCERVVPFDPGLDFLILVHPREARNPVGTARIAHRFLASSTWLESPGRSLDANRSLQHWLELREGRVGVLYPGPRALDLSEWRLSHCPSGESSQSGDRLGVVVLDGTWSQARQMMRQSGKLQALPQISFQTHRRSAYEIREQPRAVCLSSLEAIHEMLAQFGGAAVREGAHDRMLQTFLDMVAFQVAQGGPARQKSADRGFRGRI